MYTKQNFYSGQKLKASQLDAMEDGIIEALNKESGGVEPIFLLHVGTNSNNEYLASMEDGSDVPVSVYEAFIAGTPVFITFSSTAQMVLGGERFENDAFCFYTLTTNGEGIVRYVFRPVG